MIDRNKLAEICNARDVLCKFCENYDFCEKCQVTSLVNDAYAEVEDDSD